MTSGSELEEEEQKQPPFRLKDGSVKGRGLNPPFAEGNWEAIRDAVYDGRGAE